ncbi:3-phosphoshikimate 1-carboxyvinyltransferase [Falsiroseomonas selenitidurans]|uniref:3-phosphoshikimate 1-carboxyvinyltransferase n=1 Tax=Falsiroseomonas selenitidurans TaxID=2716335 RepID=A0ABX1E560_9PROT|nr:3-phosphoshikimate 1-carboxyvinyltransferase [Falsiroseomonas selenitidurans]NKC32327.1 3-phosphoshikimate 1-carboxyvinyltransferase [Falsiroseomonas selenitidurans]
MQPPPEAARKPPQPAAPAGPLRGRARVPGCRAAGHAALVLATLAAGTTAITGLPTDAATVRLAEALRALGAGVTMRADGAWLVAGRGIGGLVEPVQALDPGGSAEVATLLCGLLAGHALFAVVDGGPGLRHHPMQAVMEALAGTGARFAGRAGGLLPLAVEGAADPLPLELRLPPAAASLTSACLLAGLAARGSTRLTVPVPMPGGMETLLRHFGARVRMTAEGAARVIELEGQPELVATPVVVPGDADAATFLAVAALLVPGSDIVLEGIDADPLRGIALAALRAMGADILASDAPAAGALPASDWRVRAGALRGQVVAEAGACPAWPALAVAAAAAQGSTRLCGAGQDGPLAGAMAALLAAHGVAAVREGPDLVIQGAGGPPPGGGMVETHMDHRIAMAAMVLGLSACAPVRLDQFARIESGFPGLAALLERLAGSPVCAA